MPSPPNPCCWPRRCALGRRRLPPLAEPPEAVLAAEAWRQAWRPAGPVRLLLLAESHMATGAGELAQPLLRLPAGLDWPAPAAPRFLRHLYCPAYGEPALVPGLAPRANAGTPPYWRLMAACEGAGCPALPGLRKGSNPRLEARLAAKAALLHRLRARGIWLADASLPALSGPGQPRAAPPAIRAALEASWDGYHAPLLTALAPAHVLVIGRAVAQVLSARLDAAFPGRWSVIRQPTRALPADWAAMTAALAAAAARFAPPPPPHGAD
jgi:hypothetical protein